MRTSNSRCGPSSIEASAARAAAENSCSSSTWGDFDNCDCRLDEGNGEDCTQTCVPCTTDADCAGSIDFGTVSGINFGAVAGGVCYKTLDETCQHCDKKCDDTTTTFTGGQLDPHLFFSHGGRADFKGEDATWYNMLSAKNVSLNVFFEHADFRKQKRAPGVFQLVHGSAMTRLAMTARSAVTGELLTVEYNASSTASKARVGLSSQSAPVWLSHTHGAYTFENIKLSVLEKKMGDIGHGMALTVNTGRWEVTAWSKPFPNWRANPGKALLNVKVAALYDADQDVVAPHGLVGQSYDGDSVRVDGAQDDYSASVAEMTTKAMAEGAIEGTASDYKMLNKFTTAFKYGRFDATKAGPRDVSKLTGKKTLVKKVGHGVAGATPDVADATETVIS